jgi:ABC-2 type transport system ATP-binding protein
MDKCAIIIQNLKMSYNSETEVLKGIDLKIEAGQIIGYIGPNGAGKTTTVKILCGMIPGFEGNVEVMGLNLREESIEIKKKIGYVPEETALYDSLTPREYLEFIGGLYGMEGKEIDGKINSMLETFGILKNADARMTTFSKGMK